MRAAGGRAARAAAAVLLVAAAVGAAAADGCAVTYASSSNLTWRGLPQPLLLGGVAQGCVAGCQPRGNEWGAVCGAEPDALAVINVCEAWQRPAILEVALRVSGGAVNRFSPCDLVSQLGNRTLWLIGDSHTKNLFSALRCFLFDFWSPEQGECAASADAAQQAALERAALRGHIYNTPPRCLHLFSGARVCLLHSPMGTTLLTDDPQDPGTLQLLLGAAASPEDVLVVSFGRWHSNNCNGVDAGFGPALDRVGAYLQSQRATFPHAFFAPPDHDHTLCTAGAFNDSLPYCLPAAEAGKSLAVGAELHRLAHEIMASKYGVPVVDSHAASVFLHDGHVQPRQTIAGRVDCLHMCRPGMPEIDIWFLSAALDAHGLSAGAAPAPAPAPAPTPARECVRLPAQNFKPFGALAPQPPAPVLADAGAAGNTSAAGNATGDAPRQPGAAAAPGEPPAAAAAPPAGAGDAPSVAADTDLLRGVPPASVSPLLELGPLAARLLAPGADPLSQSPLDLATALYLDALQQRVRAEQAAAEEAEAAAAAPEPSAAEPAGVVGGANATIAAPAPPAPESAAVSAPAGSCTNSTDAAVQPAGPAASPSEQAAPAAAEPAAPGAQPGEQLAAPGERPAAAGAAGTAQQGDQGAAAAAAAAAATPAATRHGRVAVAEPWRARARAARARAVPSRAPWEAQERQGAVGDAA
ncbi:hypothetical protein HT031_003212 [Scenedesmus sp. PABB004]|nr:hypothetical protein HT031_003212 [Scenedesmus sp. PABB004]